MNRLHSIPADDPLLTPDNWCQAQPCRTVRIGSRSIILSQLSSTFYVYFLGLQTIFVGCYFGWIQGEEWSRFWWSASLWLWGIGAILAGTSHQLFGYEIKCPNRKICSWTSWWEVVYLMFQHLSMNAMLAGVAFSCATGALRSALLIYAVISSIVYGCILWIGATRPIKFLITFEFMVLVQIPAFLALVVLNGWRYHVLGTDMDLALLWTWVFLLLCGIIYWIYDKSGITEKLWARGSWFSQNDVLHVCLITWMFYILFVLAPLVQDIC